MHLLVGAHDLYPDSGSGGTGRYVYETGRRLADRGHRVSVVTRRRGDDPARERIAGMDVARYDVSIADEPLPRILPQVPGALRTVKRHVSDLSAGSPPDVVSYQGPVTSLLVERALAGEVPRTAVFHSPWPEEYGIKTRAGDGVGSMADASGPVAALRRRANVWARSALEGRTLDRIAGVVTLSEFMRRVLRETYGGVAPARVVPGGVDLDRFAPDAGTYEPVATDGVAFLTVRRLTPRMGHGLLLEGFARLARHRDDVELYVAGDGPLRKSLVERAAALGITDRTTFLGYVPDEVLPRAYATADVFVLPTVEMEGFGLATLEAMAAGLPVVGTAVGATPEILGPLEATGSLPEPVLVDPVDTNVLADRLLAWTELDDAERARAGRTCREYASRRFPWRRTVARLEEYYDGMASTERVSPRSPTDPVRPARGR